MPNIRVILGTMTVGGTLNEKQSHDMIKEFVELGNSEVDTAILYQDGRTEKVIGLSELCRDQEKVHIACKANPYKGFTADKVVEQLNTSLKNLQIEKCDIFYLHAPDNSIPVAETLKGVDQLYKEGKFKEFGVSNHAAWQVADIYHICKNNGYVLPTVYQGMYNVFSRELEDELVPALRNFGIRLYAYSPLAGGLLSGKYDFSKPTEEQASGRFFGHSEGDDYLNRWTEVFQHAFWKPCFKEGVVHVTHVLSKVYDGKVSLIEASLRWLRHHSKLIVGDGIIIGCSKPHHFKSNVMACKNDEPLHEDVVKAFNEGWEGIRTQAPPYHH